MQGIKNAIILAQHQRSDLNQDLVKIELKLSTTKLKLTACYVLVYGLFEKSIPEKIEADISAQKNTITELENQIEKCYVNLIINFDDEFELKYNNLLENFNTICTSHKIWDITNESFQDTIQSRSSAGTLVKEKEVRFGLKSLVDIKSNYKALHYQNANGAYLSFYPNFIVMYSSKQQFAIIGMEEMNFHHRSVRFIETGIIRKIL